MQNNNVVELFEAIESIDRSIEGVIDEVINNKTKPIGALGQLESVAKQLALISYSANNGYEHINIEKASMIVFAGDHGIAEESISIAPSEVTQQMVHNFLNGGAAINCFCRSNHIELKVVDSGILNGIDDSRLVQYALGKGTKNFSQDKAMTMGQVEEGLLLGADIVNQQIDNGIRLLGFGEMGIGNTSSASAIMSAILELDVQECVGKGTGINEEALNKKIELIQQAMKLHCNEMNSPLDVLCCVGGYEIVQMVGAMLQSAKRKIPVLVDGFIASAAALVASKINVKVLDYFIFCHQSNEQGHQKMLAAMQAKPLLNLGLRLGEGTGAALAVPLVRAAASFYNDMASFESAGIESV